MSAETVTFQNIDLYGAETPQIIYDIGAEKGGTGVIHEIARAFKHTLTPEPDVDNLGELIGKVGPAKELQQNIGRVQDVLGTDKDAFGIARGWVKRSGLLLPVERGYLDPNERPVYANVFLMSDGVRNWMQRRCSLLEEFGPFSDSDIAILGAGSRVMSESEGPDVTKGMLASEYMKNVIAPRVAATGLRTELITTPTEEGDKVMDAIAYRAHRLFEEDKQFADVEPDNLPDMILVSNAGAWPQNGGQAHRALSRGLYPNDAYFEFDELADSFFVAAKNFPVANNESDPKTTHQNPLAALGMILRGAQEMLRHIDH